MTVYRIKCPDVMTDYKNIQCLFFLYLKLTNTKTFCKTYYYDVKIFKSTKNEKYL